MNRENTRNTLLRFLFFAIFLAYPSVSLPDHNNSPTRLQNVNRSSREVYGPAIVTGRLKAREINESSGLVASRTRGVYWTHNDSGDGPFIYAIDEKGTLRGIWRVAGAGARDWEDIAAGPGPDPQKRYLYVGDIGDNESKRLDMVVYRFPEPSLTAAIAHVNKTNARITEPAEAIRLRYPDGSHDAEALLVHPVSGDIYIITKTLLGKAVVYKTSQAYPSSGAVLLTREAELNIPSLLGGLITGGDISPNGHRVALCDYLGGYELVLPDADANFDDIWNRPIVRIELGRRGQREAIAYRQDGRALLTTSEGVGAPLVEVVRR